MLSEAFICLALNIFYEARSEETVGQYAVALVTLNRAKSSTVCKEVFAEGQFSWTNSLMEHERDLEVLVQQAEAIDGKSWDKSKRVAKLILNKKILDFTDNSTYYHTVNILPKWAKRLTKTVKRGSHIFYRKLR